jgi:hypothetical protein
MKKFAIVVMSAAASMAMAMGTMTSTSSGESPMKVYTNIDMNMTKLMSDGLKYDMGYNLTVGTDAAYMFTNEMGASLGLDFNMVSAETTTAKSKVNFLDIPVNFVYNMSFSKDLNALVGVGPYLGMPLGKMKAEGFDDLKIETIYGLNLESHINYAMSSDFALGGHVGFKYAFSDMNKSDGMIGTQNYWALGLGLSAKFL